MKFSTTAASLAGKDFLKSFTMALTALLSGWLEKAFGPVVNQIAFGSVTWADLSTTLIIVFLVLLAHIATLACADGGNPPRAQGHHRIKSPLGQTVLEFAGQRRTEKTMQIRVLATAADSSKAWDLRCAIREQLISYIQEHHPESLPQLRGLNAGALPDNGRSLHRAI